jgi:hypothetical protein
MISINPVITTRSDGTFSVSLDGLMQGMAMDDPAVRFQLTGGQVAPGEALPMFGGVPIAEYIPPATNPMDRALQNLVTRATVGVPANGVPVATGTMTGISVFNQNHAMINSVSSPVPQADSGMLCNFYRFGTRARIAMSMDPALDPTTTPAGSPGSIYKPITWDVANQRVSLTPAAAGFLAFPLSVKMIDFNFGNSMVVVYTALTGFATWNRQGSACLLEI